MADLVCKNLTKQYKDKVVLSGLDLTLEPGKIYGLVGRNGVGKTTLISLITGQAMATSGEILLGDKEVWENQEVIDHLCFSREINTMSTFGPNNLKVSEYLNTAAIFYPNWDAKMAEELVSLFKLDKKQHIFKLSKGMLSMLTIVIGLASKSDYTFLDEPVAGLDVVARKQFYDLLLDEQQSSGRTYVISTHIIEEAADLFEEVIFLHNQKIMLKENTLNLLDRAIYVTGKAEVVDDAVKNLNVVHSESIGRSKAATILLESGQTFAGGPELTVQPINLQNLFVAMCGQEA